VVTPGGNQARHTRPAVLQVGDESDERNTSVAEQQHISGTNKYCC